jgi:hypothetical protein
MRGRTHRLVSDVVINYHHVTGLLLVSQNYDELHMIIITGVRMVRFLHMAQGVGVKDETLERADAQP